MYEEAVSEARRLVRRSEEDQWRLAQLTWEQIEAGKSGAQWARDIGVHPSHVYRLYEMWQRLSDSDRVKEKQQSFAEAYEAVKNPGARREATIERAIRNMPPEQKIEIANALLDDTRVAENVAPRVEAFSRLRQVPEAELRKAYMRVPEEIRNESLGAPTGVSQYLAEMRTYLRLTHELAESPRVNWEGYRAAVAEELRRIARQADGIAEIIEDPSRGQATDEALEQLLRDVR